MSSSYEVTYTEREGNFAVMAIHYSRVNRIFPFKKTSDSGTAMAVVSLQTSPDENTHKVFNIYRIIIKNALNEGIEGKNERAYDYIERILTILIKRRKILMCIIYLDDSLSRCSGIQSIEDLALHIFRYSQYVETQMGSDVAHNRFVKLLHTLVIKGSEGESSLDNFLAEIEKEYERCLPESLVKTNESDRAETITVEELFDDKLIEPMPVIVKSDSSDNVQDDV